MDDHDEIIKAVAVVETLVKGTNDRLDTINGSVANIKERVRTLEDQELLRAREEKKSRTVISWVIDNLASIATAVLVAILLFSIGLN